MTIAQTIHTSRVASSQGANVLAAYSVPTLPGCKPGCWVLLADGDRFRVTFHADGESEFGSGYRSATIEEATAAFAERIRRVAADRAIFGV